MGVGHVPIIAGSGVEPPPSWTSRPHPGTLVGVLALELVDIVGLVGILGGCAGLYYLSSRIEPHWVSKDQSRFLTVAQELDQHGLPIGRKRDVRVHIDDESDALLVSRRSFLRPSSAVWTVKSKSTISRNRNVYVLRPASPTPEVAFLAIRVPQSSKVTPRLDALLEMTGEQETIRRQREQYRAQLGQPQPATEASDSPGSPLPDPPSDRG
jgi:hypothetical protein